MTQAMEFFPARKEPRFLAGSRASYADDRTARPKPQRVPTRRLDARPELKTKVPSTRSAPGGATKPTKAAVPNADGEYELGPRSYHAVRSELDYLKFQLELDLPETVDLECEGEKDIVERWRNEMGDHLKDVLGLNVTKRLLNIFNPLNVKVHFTTKPDRKYLSTFLKRYNFVAFKRMPGVVNTFAAQVKTIEDFDALCTAKSVHCGAAKITITPFYRFLQCPKKVKTGFCNPELLKIKGSNNNTEKEGKSKDDGMISVKSENSSKSKPDVSNEKPKSAPVLNKPAATTEEKTAKAKKIIAPKKETPQTKKETATPKEAATKPKVENAPKTQQPKPKVEPPKTNTATIANVEPPKGKVPAPAPKVEPPKDPVLASKVEPLKGKVAKPAPKIEPSKGKVVTPTPKVEVAIKVATTTPKIEGTTKVPTTTPEVKAAAKVATTTPKSEAPKPKISDSTVGTPKAKPIPATKPQAGAPVPENTKPKVEPAKTNVANKPQVASNATKIEASKTGTKIDDKAKNTPKVAVQPKIAANTKPGLAKTVAKIPASNTKAKPATSKTVPAKKNVFPNKKATKKAIEKDDFEELDDHDILALISEGIVLDECSGSDDE